MTVGLVVASGLLIAEASATHWRLAVLILVAAGLGMVKKLHPLWILAGGAVLGLLIA
ncbi:hypothetical protein D3C79_1015950 [compost metagenome]